MRSQEFVLKGFGNCICPVTTTKPNVEHFIISESSHELVNVLVNSPFSPEVNRVLIFITVLELQKKKNGIM